MNLAGPRRMKPCPEPPPVGPFSMILSYILLGDPRLLIRRYGPPLVPVDLTFIALTDAAHRVEEPLIPWERDDQFTEVLKKSEAEYPMPKPARPTTTMAEGGVMVILKKVDALEKTEGILCRALVDDNGQQLGLGNPRSLGFVRSINNG